MDNSTRLLIKVKDPHADLDPKFTQPIIEGQRQGRPVLYVHLVVTGPWACPHCHQAMRKNGFKQVTIIGQTDHDGRQTIFKLRKQKFFCPQCSNEKHMVTAIMPFSDVAANHQISHQVKLNIIHDLTDSLSQKKISELNGVSVSTVQRVLNELNHDYGHPQRQWLPAHIAMDDFKAGKMTDGGMSMLMMNADNHRVLEVFISRKNYLLTDDLLRYPLAARMAVKTVTVDLYEPYRKIIHRVFPNAQIIADPFHVIVQAYQALQRIRLQVMNRYPKGSHTYNALKSLWKELFKRHEDLDTTTYYRWRNFRFRQLTENEAVDKLLDISADLAQAYWFYQDLRQAMQNKDADQLKQLLSSKDYQAAPKQLRKAIRTLRKHQEEILNYFKFGTSNGPVEGANNKIKVLKRVSYGFRSFINFRIRILLCFKNSFLSMNVRNQIKEKAVASNKLKVTA